MCIRCLLIILALAFSLLSFSVEIALRSCAHFKSCFEKEKEEEKWKDFWNYCFKFNDSYPMDLISIPFSPRYKSNARVVRFILGGRLNDEDIVQEIYQKGLCTSQKKIASFLEDENYVMRNTFPSIQKCGFVSC